ncbi:MAG: FtsX-like permease family protein [Bacteroidales bacterium]|nr:FtsX-like permease family protein [Bacteroidales bacterium]
MKNAQHKTALFIALRYLFSKKQHNIINVISFVSMIGIMVSATALIVVLSVFNGMGDMIGGWFNAFNPDFEISLAEGKSFEVDSFPTDKIAALPDVKDVHEVVSDMVLVTYGERQELLRLKGVSKSYIERANYQQMLIDGTFDFYKGEQPCAVIGTVAAGKLQINLNRYDLLKIYYPKRTKKNLANPAEAFNTRFLFPTGVFSTNTDNDQSYIFCPIEFVRDLMQYDGEVTSIEVETNNPKHLDKCQSQIQQIIGEKYVVKNKYQQEESLFKTMQSEKLVIYVILAFILLVAAFNIIGSLGILILEKQNDNAILRSMGASASLIQRIFIYEGIAISFIGGIVGILLGALICFLQQTFHLVKLGGAGYLIQYYPVQMHISDFALVLVTVLIISFLTSVIPAINLKKNISQTSNL